MSWKCTFKFYSLVQITTGSAGVNKNLQIQEKPPFDIMMKVRQPHQIKEVF